MAYEFRLQDPGEGIHEAEILEILVSKGDHVHAGENVLVAETDKAAVEIPAPIEGNISEITVGEGDLVKVGDILIVFERDGDAPSSDSKDTPGGESKNGVEEPEDTEKARPQRAKDGKEQQADAIANERHEQKDEQKDVSSSNEAPKADVLATPAVRGLARDHNVYLDAISGSGEDGRILEKDVLSAARAKAEPDTSNKAPAESSTWSEKLRSIRRATARRMTKSWNEIPHVTHHDKIDISAIEQLRAEQECQVEETGGKLTLTPFLIKAIATALGEHPRFNATFNADTDEIIFKDKIHMGVALDTEKGLLVPVLRDADQKSVLDLAVELTQISETLRNGRAQGDMLKGGTFTLTNVGAIGGTGFSPIINPPQVSIFGAARAELREVFQGTLDDPQPDIALLLPVCIAFDHRVNDGADAARFMNEVKRLLSDPSAFLVNG